MIQNNYLMKAMDAYPYYLTEAIEALNYALSYDGENVFTLHLVAKVYAEQFRDYRNAMAYFEEAMAADMHQPAIYCDYIKVCIIMEEYSRAQKLIDFALKLKGTDKSEIYYLHSYLKEANGKYKKALKSLKKARQHAFNNNCISIMDDTEKRIKEKMTKKENDSK